MFVVDSLTKGVSVELQEKDATCLNADYRPINEVSSVEDCAGACLHHHPLTKFIMHSTASQLNCECIESRFPCATAPKRDSNIYKISRRLNLLIVLDNS